VSEAKPKDGSAFDADLAAPASAERYLVFDEIGVGGMASVHLGMLTGAVGFRRIVALKQLHARFIHDPDFVAQFINEARLAARIHHANVVQTLDVVWTGTQLLLVMEYVDGDTLNRVLRSAVERRQQVPIEVACSMVTGVLHGLHAAHEVRDEEGARLDIVHRDVSPQNILIGRDGIARVLDFGVAKALAQSPNTQSGLLKGKFGYMAPEQLMRGHVDRRTDVFAAGVVLWETLTCRRLFQASKNIEQAMSRVVTADIPPPSLYRSEIPPKLDAIVMKSMERDADNRFQSAEELAIAMEGDVGVASPHLVKSWFGPLASPELAQRAELIRNINKRHGTPGRSTPHPFSLTDEARAALTSGIEAEKARRKALAELGAGPSSGASGTASLGGASPGGLARGAGSGSVPPGIRSFGSVAPGSVPPGHLSLRVSSYSQTMRSRTDQGLAPSSSGSPTQPPLSRSGKFAYDALSLFVKRTARTLPPPRSRAAPSPVIDEQFVPTTSGHISDIPEPDAADHSRLRRWARNVGGTVLALTMFMATWVTAIGWKDQPPTSERLRARRAAALEAARVAPSATSLPNAPASVQLLDTRHPAALRELSTRTESLRPSPARAEGRAPSPRAKTPEREAPPPSGLELRLTR
jgi:serine/threonine protein kinase